LAMYSGKTPEVQAAAPNFGDPVPASVIVTHNGLEWVWASPCALNGCTTGILIGHDGFNFATVAQWALRPPVLAFRSGDQNICASPYFNKIWNHCDWDDIVRINYGSAPKGGLPTADGEPMDQFGETFLVRSANQPPLANAGLDQNSVEWTAGGTSVTLDGTGSSDLDSDRLTYSWSGDLGTASVATPTLPVPGLGIYVVTLIVNDGTVDSEPDSVTITVVDTAAPTVLAALVPVGGDDDDEGTFRVEFSCSDNCDQNPNISSATLNGVAVINGQLVSLELDDEEEVKTNDGILSIEAPLFLLSVTCIDASDNSNTATAVPTFTGGDDDSDDSSDDDNSDD
jgi:hypothetical protein